MSTYVHVCVGACTCSYVHVGVCVSKSARILYDQMYLFMCMYRHIARETKLSMCMSVYVLLCVSLFVCVPYICVCVLTYAEIA